MARVDDVWRRFREALVSEKWAEEDGEIDRTIAAFVAANPGSLENRLLGGASEMAQSPAPKAFSRCVSELGMLLCLNSAPRGPGQLARTLRVLAPDPMLQLYLLARNNYPTRLGIGYQNSVCFAQGFVQRCGLDVLDRLPLVPENRDILWSLVTQRPLPEILPADLASFTAEEIGNEMARYTGKSLADLERDLRPGSASQSGFLGEFERLGEVILRDAQTLDRLGISRQQVAINLQLILDMSTVADLGAFLSRNPDIDLEKRRDKAIARVESVLGRVKVTTRLDRLPWVFGTGAALGDQFDPFHSAISRGSTSFWIEGPGIDIRGGELTIEHIRRACFFEGSVPFRIDPTAAARFGRLVENWRRDKSSI